MSARRLIFKILMVVSLVLLDYVSLYAASPRQGLRQHDDYAGWQRLIPTHAKFQYAGSMGVVSAGVGWDYGKHNQWESDVMVGYLPQKYMDATRATFALRQTYLPWCLALGERTTFEPLSCGVYLTAITGDKFWIKEPDKYGGQYYKFPTRLRLHACLGQRINFSQLSRGWLQGVSVYYELSACDLNVIAKTTNSKLKLSDIVYFSAGVRLQIIQPR